MATRSAFILERWAALGGLQTARSSLVFGGRTRSGPYSAPRRLSSLAVLRLAQRRQHDRYGFLFVCRVRRDKDPGADCVGSCKASLIIPRTRWGTYLVSDRLREGAEVDVLLGVDRRGMVDTQPEVDLTADSRTSEAHHSDVFWRVQ